MSGLIKSKKYDWKDSNLALFGSDLERNVKKHSASTEVAWRGVGQKPGLQIWRIVKFKVTDWPKEDYGKFYSGDSYIVLNTYKEPDREGLLYDVHFWIGQHSTQDEYGTAAYKTVELDTFLDDIPVQHREVQNHESDLFKSYFTSLTYMSGGAETGFRRVQAKEYKPRLLHFCGVRRNVVVKEVPLSKKRLNSDDVFILDLGLKIFQWNGNGCNKDERFKAMQYVQGMKSERSGRASVEVLEEVSCDQDTEFYQLIDKEDDGDDYDDGSQFLASDLTTELYRLSDASGKMEFSQSKRGSVNMSDLDTKDVFIIDTKSALYVWIGQRVSSAEKKNAMCYAHNYLMATDHPLLSVTCEKEGRESCKFFTAIAA